MIDVGCAECCAICGAEDLDPMVDCLRDGTSDHRVYRCEACDYTQLLPRPTVEQDKAYYDQNGQDRTIRERIDLTWERQAFSLDVERRSNAVSALFRKGSTLLDVGTGYGFFLEEMAARGFSVRGIEIGRERREMARDVTSAPIDETNLVVEHPDPEQAADVVTLFHVLEHVADPISFAKKLRTLVRPGGALVCEVPNVNELLLDTCPEYWHFYWIRAHLSYFSDAILKRVLHQAGFASVEVTFIQRYGIENLGHWLAFGKPQIQRPLFRIDRAYRWLEDSYRDQLSIDGRTDTLWAVARV